MQRSALTAFALVCLVTVSATASEQVFSCRLDENQTTSISGFEWLATANEIAFDVDARTIEFRGPHKVKIGGDPDTTFSQPADGVIQGSGLAPLEGDRSPYRVSWAFGKHPHSFVFSARGPDATYVWSCDR